MKEDCVYAVFVHDGEGVWRRGRFSRFARRARVTEVENEAKFIQIAPLETPAIPNLHPVPRVNAMGFEHVRLAQGLHALAFTATDGGELLAPGVGAWLPYPRFVVAR